MIRGENGRGWRHKLGFAVVAVLLVAVTVPARAGIEVASTRVVGDVPMMSDNVDYAGSIPIASAIGARFRGNLMYVTGAAGLEIFDVSTPTVPLPVGKLAFPHYENEDVSLGGNTLLLSSDYFVGGDSLTTVAVIDISNPALPLVKSFNRTGRRGHTASCVNPYPEPDVRNCQYAYLAGGTGLGVFDTATGTVVKNPVATATGSTHDVQFDSDGYAWVVGNGGTAGYDVTDPLNPVLMAKTDPRGAIGPLNDFIHHNSGRPDRPGQPGVPGDIVLVTEEDYMNVNCNGAGLFQSWRINGQLSASSPAVLTPIDTWDTGEGRLPSVEDKTQYAAYCSSHYFDIRDGLAAVAWYGNGTRILDVSNPADIRQVGYFVPTKAEAWAAYWHPTDDSVVYVIDDFTGVDILRVHRDAPPDGIVPLTASQERAMAARASIGTKPHPEFGWACRIAA